MQLVFYSWIIIEMKHLEMNSAADEDTIKKYVLIVILNLFVCGKL